MKRVSVTLLADVPGLGAKGDVVQCSPGYARNALFARGLGRPTVAKDEREAGARATERQKTLARLHEEEERLRIAIAGSVVTVEARANANGKLYGSIGAPDVTAALAASGKRGITSAMVEGSLPITMLGEHAVRIAIAGSRTSVTVRVVAQKET